MTKHIDRLLFDVALRRRTPRAFATPTLVALNVVLFIVMVAAGVHPLNPDAMTLLRWGGDLASRTVNGEWWRLATSMFIHAGALHLAFNMFGLLQVALIVERLVGSACFLGVYAVTGVVASLASLYVHPASVSVGASGAIFGIYGCGLAIFAKASGYSLFEIFSHTTKPDDEPSVISLNLSSTDAADSWPTETAADAEQGRIPSAVLKPLAASVLTFIFYNFQNRQPGIDHAFWDGPSRQTLRPRGHRYGESCGRWRLPQSYSARPSLNCQHSTISSRKLSVSTPSKRKSSPS